MTASRIARNFHTFGDGGGVAAATLRFTTLRINKKTKTVGTSMSNMIGKLKVILASAGYAAVSATSPVMVVVCPI